MVRTQIYQNVLPECGLSVMTSPTSKRFENHGIGWIVMNKPVLPDTDVMIDFLRGNPKVYIAINSAGHTELA